VSLTDITLTLLLGIGLAQFALLSVMLHRRGIKAERIISSMPPLMAIWVLFWPVYVRAEAILLGICLLALCIIMASTMRQSCFSALKSSWSDREHGLLPFAMFTLAPGAAMLVFLNLPEFGFGIALVLCLGPTAADWLDRSKIIPLGFPANPAQTLPGHLFLILAVSLLSGWSLLIFHDLGWNQVLMATTLAGAAASATRAMIPAPINLPLIVAAMAATLWAL